MKYKESIDYICLYKISLYWKNEEIIIQKNRIGIIGKSSSLA